MVDRPTDRPAVSFQSTSLPPPLFLSDDSAGTGAAIRKVTACCSCSFPGERYPTYPRTLFLFQYKSDQRGGTFSACNGFKFAPDNSFRLCYFAGSLCETPPTMTKAFANSAQLPYYYTAAALRVIRPPRSFLWPAKEISGAAM